MSRSLLLLPLLFLAPVADAPGSPRDGQPTASATGAAPEPPPAGYHQVKLNGHTFTLPEGFTIELAAGADLVPRPIVAAFDEKGRLYVCDSSGSNEKVQVQLEKKPHRIVRLEDANGDGKYEKSTVYVPNVMFPEGAMWLNGSLYVAAPPHIWKFTDTNDDGTADKQEVWFDGKTLGGCANDLHGPYLGPDGWVYWCKGGFEPQEFTLPGGKKIMSRAAHVYRARPDGSGREAVMTGGMDNPVDVVFTPGGERIFSTTFFQHPGGGRRDGLVHAIYGGVYGKDHAPIYEHPWTSPHLMPVLTHLGPAAPCGLHRYESDQFGKDYADNVFCCQFNLRKVSRHVLVPKGSTFETKDSDFVVSDNIDFHPTDVIEDADGSLLIVDTGGWYKLCCPTSQLVKPDVTGAIYRIKKAGAHKVDDPRGQKIDWTAPTPDLTIHLEDARPVVRQKAIDVIAARGEPAAKVLAQLALNLNVHDSRRAGAVWALARIDGPEARKAVRYSLEDTNAAVRLAALHCVSLWRDREAVPMLVARLVDDDWHARRLAAEALGRIGDVKAVPALLASLVDEKNDRELDHALTYALIEIGDPKETARGLSHPSPRVRRAALAALDAMPGGNLDAKVVIRELDADDPALKETAWWIAGKHPAWGEHLVGYFREQLTRVEAMIPADRDDLTARLAKFAANADVQRMMGEALAQRLSPDTRLLLVRAMARSGVKALPSAWVDGLRASMEIRDQGVAAAVIAVLRTAPPNLEQFEKVRSGMGWLVRYDGDREPWVILTFQLLATAPPAAFRISDSNLATWHRHLHPIALPELRTAVIDTLLRAPLTSQHLIDLADILWRLGPIDLARLLPVFEKSKDEKVGLALVAGLTYHKVRPMIRTEQVKPILDKYPKTVRDEAEKLYALLAEARKEETAKLERLVKELPAGDVRRGQAVFNGTKAQCIACHKVGYVGGLVGPDLTRIGGIRTERDLLESIVFPSASFVRSYETVKVRTLDGRALNGIFKKDAPDEIVLVIAADKEDRIARADIEDISPGTVSVMPAGLEQQLTVQELADLVAFLKACK